MRATTCKEILKLNGNDDFCKKRHLVWKLRSMVRILKLTDKTNAVLSEV